MYERAWDQDLGTIKLTPLCDSLTKCEGSGGVSVYRFSFQSIVSVYRNLIRSHSEVVCVGGVGGKDPGQSHPEGAGCEV